MNRWKEEEDQGKSERQNKIGNDIGSKGISGGRKDALARCSKGSWPLLRFHIGSVWLG